MDFNGEFGQALSRVARESAAEGRLPDEAVLPGVRALDFWSEGPNAAMLFWVDRETARNPLGSAELHDVIVTREDGTWRSMGGAGATTEPWDELLASAPSCLSRFGGSSAGSIRVTWATASPEVATIRLRDRDGGTRDRRPGRHGFVLLGITPEDPITYAYAIGHSGNQLPGEPILL